MFRILKGRRNAVWDAEFQSVRGGKEIGKKLISISFFFLCDKFPFPRDKSKVKPELLGDDDFSIPTN